jgi:hypothetical protein
MSTDAVTPLRQRMIEDMNARKLGVPHATQSQLWLRPARRRGGRVRLPVWVMGVDFRGVSAMAGLLLTADI